MYNVIHLVYTDHIIIVLLMSLYLSYTSALSGDIKEIYSACIIVIYSICIIVINSVCPVLLWCFDQLHVSQLN